MGSAALSGYNPAQSDPVRSHSPDLQEHAACGRDTSPFLLAFVIPHSCTLSVSLPLSLCLSVSLACLSLSLSRSLCLSVCLSVCLPASVCPSVGIALDAFAVPHRGPPLRGYEATACALFSPKTPKHKPNRLNLSDGEGMDPSTQRARVYGLLGLLRAMVRFPKDEPRFWGLQGSGFLQPSF